METNNLNSISYLDILFTGKNKKYGAYQLRAGYDKRIRTATLSTIFGLSLLLFLATLGHQEESTTYCPMIPVETLPPPPRDREEPPVPEPQKPQAQPQAPSQAQQKYTPPKILEDNQVDNSDVPRTDDLNNTQISDHTTAGRSTDDPFLVDVDLGTQGQSLPSRQIQNPKPNDDNKIHEVVAQEAEYPGGTSAMLSDISRNFKYSIPARENGITGRVIVKFVVEKDGSISHITVTRSLGYGLDEAAVDVVRKLKRFAPAMQDGKKVRSYMSLPIRCELN